MPSRNSSAASAVRSADEASYAEPTDTLPILKTKMHMIRRLLISTLLTALAAMAVSAAKPSEKTDSLTAADFFANAPLRIFPTIDRTTRLDMLDYYRSGSDKPSKNAFKGNARVLAASPSQITFSTSDVQEVELSLIPHRGDTLLMVITTVSTPAPDSEVRFYTTAWEPVDRGLFIVPQLSEWIAPEGADRRDDLENLYPITLARAVYDPSTRTLTLQNKLGDFLAPGEGSWADGLLRGELVYRWNGKKMEKVK